MSEVNTPVINLLLAFEQDNFEETVLAVKQPFKVSYQDALLIYSFLLKLEKNNYLLMRDKMAFFHEKVLKVSYTDTRGSIESIFAYLVLNENLPQDKQFQFFDLLFTLTDHASKSYFIQSLTGKLTEINNSYYDTSKVIHSLSLYGKSFFHDKQKVFRQCNSVFLTEKDFITKLKDIFAPYLIENISFNSALFSKEQNEHFFQSAFVSKEWRKKILFLKRQNNSFACLRLQFTYLFKPETNQFSLREIDREKTNFILNLVGKKQFLFFLEKEPYLTTIEKQLFKDIAHGH